MSTISIEYCWVLVGKLDARRCRWRLRRRRRVQGQAVSVQADWAWTLAREERHGDVVGFWHTHPGGAGTAPSDRDVRTMRAWSSALGKPLVCVIAAGQAFSAYIFPDDKTRARRAQLSPARARGVFIVRTDAMR